MGGQAAHWSPYDFTPIDNPYSTRRRLRSEISPLHQSLPEVQRTTNHRQLGRGLGDEEEEEEEIEIENEATTTDPSAPIDIRCTGQSHAGNNTSDLSVTNRPRNAVRVPGIGDFLGSFQQPQATPTFKTEPLDEEIMNLPLRRPTGKRRKKTSTRGQTPSVRPSPGTSRGSRQTRDITRKQDTNARSYGCSVQALQPDRIVDLTNDEDEQVPAPDQDRGVTNLEQTHTRQVDQYSFWGSHNPDMIPSPVLQQVREQYRQEGVATPPNIITWQQLRAFVSGNLGPSYVTLSTISQLQRQYSAADPGYQVLTSTILTQRAPEDPQSRGPSQQQTVNQLSGLQSLPPRDDTHVANVSQYATSIPDIKRELKDVPLPHSNTMQKLYENVNTYISPMSRSRARNAVDTSDENDLSPSHMPTHVPFENLTSRPVANDTSVPHANIIPLPYPNITMPPAPTPPNTITTPVTAPDTLTLLMRSTSALSSLLPPNSPANHPHFVNISHPTLLALPTTQHDHLNLVDTVVSIIANYDMKDQSALRALLDVDKNPNFYFLFKSRSDRWHSWSVARTKDVVTIGIERNTRAANLTDSERPSNGQFDVSIQYRMDAHTLASPVPTNLPGETSNSNADLVNAVSNAIANDITPLISDGPTIQSLESPIVPGRWTPVGISVFPLSPSLETFLHSTPPNRGADEHSNFMHPAQTLAMPASHLSMLARYFQLTAFTCGVMEAEMQVVYGRRVRYDSGLGRIRAVTDHALKGAKTQAEKRKKGEYNRPVGGEDESEEEKKPAKKKKGGKKESGGNAKSGGNQTGGSLVAMVDNGIGVGTEATTKEDGGIQTRSRSRVDIPGFGGMSIDQVKAMEEDEEVSGPVKKENKDKIGGESRYESFDEDEE